MCKHFVYLSSYPNALLRCHKIDLCGNICDTAKIDLHRQPPTKVAPLRHTITIMVNHLTCILCHYLLEWSVCRLSNKQLWSMPGYTLHGRDSFELQLQHFSSVLNSKWQLHAVVNGWFFGSKPKSLQLQIFLKWAPALQCQSWFNMISTNKQREKRKRNVPHAFNSIHSFRHIVSACCCSMIKHYRVSKSNIEDASLPFGEQQTQTQMHLWCSLFLLIRFFPFVQMLTIWKREIDDESVESPPFKISDLKGLTTEFQ